MANPRLRALTRWGKWAKKDWAIAAVGFTIILFALTLLFDSRNPTTPDLSAHDLVPLTLLHRAKATGALCLDGSLPGYHFQKGFGSGSNNWLLHIEGGGWCNSIETCNIRKRTALGSSNYMDRLVPFAGILSRQPSQNPDFYNWNIVKIRYCDGASLAGHPESEFKNGTKLFFRGQLIWEAIMSELLSLGLSKAKQALLSGCSAGGLATLIHCDDFRDHLPKDAIVKCLADAAPAGSDPHGYWRRCRLTIKECDSTQIGTLQGFRSSLLKALSKLEKDKEGGMFINSCFVHCQTWMAETWHSPNSPRINDKTIAESVGDWYFGRKPSKEIDCLTPAIPLAITWTSHEVYETCLEY
ncbi:Pectin acetylesterase 5 [Hibiscus syriacus]|uniref:Pectin acetylesterase n=1 Tax=Hibiscus syriacus TaxID=106335 RepID=A0A6A2ZZE4_HIBSY|nr:Pectin acetylesterase 5 [Hibiscus syriacus]